MNEVYLMGKLSKEPELKKGKTSGKSYAWLSLSVKKKFKKKDDPARNQYDFINFTAYGGVAEQICKHAHKGTTVCLKGSVSSSKQNKNGTEIWTLVFVPEMAEIVYGTGEEEKKEESLPYFDDVDISDIDPDNLPF